MGIVHAFCLLFKLTTLSLQLNDLDLRSSTFLAEPPLPSPSHSLNYKAISPHHLSAPSHSISHASSLMPGQPFAFSSRSTVPLETLFPSHSTAMTPHSRERLSYASMGHSYLLRSDLEDQGHLSVQVSSDKVASSPISHSYTSPPLARRCINSGEVYSTWINREQPGQSLLGSSWEIRNISNVHDDGELTVEDLHVSNRNVLLSKRKEGDSANLYTSTRLYDTDSRSIRASPQIEGASNNGGENGTEQRAHETTRTVLPANSNTERGRKPYDSLPLQTPFTASPHSSVGEKRGLQSASLSLTLDHIPVDSVRKEKVCKGV